MTRALSRLLHGDLIGAANFNIAVFPLIFAMIALIILDSKKIFNTHKKS